MAEPATGVPVEARLRDLLAAELRAAEADYPYLPRPIARPARRSLPVGILVVLVAVIGAILLLARLLGTEALPPGGPVLGPDGLPTSIDGEPVLRGSAIAARVGEPGSFLAGGYLVLASAPCPTAMGDGTGACRESWELTEDAATAAAGAFPLSGIVTAPGFVRTSGAPTIVRVVASATGGPDLDVQAVVWRQPTKGRIPDAALPAQGGQLNDALVPDFVSAWARDGVTIAGYVPKRYLIGDVLPSGSPPQPPPAPLYGPDLTTLVGHMVPGQGFVPLSSSTP